MIRRLNGYVMHEDNNKGHNMRVKGKTFMVFVPWGRLLAADLWRHLGSAAPRRNIKTRSEKEGINSLRTGIGG